MSWKRFSATHGVMRRCTALRDSSAVLQARRFPPQWRPYTSEAPRDDAEASTPSPEARQSGKDDSYTVDPEAKRVETVVGSLPLSPVMDPTYWEATQRHKKTKPKAGKAQNSVERQFRINPYAQALATPLRNDPISSVRLPTFFLQDFDIVAHPETGSPWWVPRSLALKKPPAAEAEEETETDEVDGMQIDETEDFAENGAEPLAEAGSAQQTESRPGNQEGPTKYFGPSAYALARKDFLESFMVKDSGFFGVNRRLMAMSSSPLKIVASKAVWREDMATFVLDLMRQRVVQDLLYLSKMCAEQKRYYIVKCYGWDDVKFKHKGSVLWFADPVEDAGKNLKAPGPFATYEFETDSEVRLGLKAKTSVAVHNMDALLGSHYATQVKKEAAVLRDGSLFMAAGRRTTNLQMNLWGLEGYLADDRYGT